MKKLLSILAAVGLVATSSTAVVSCSVFDSGSLTVYGADDLNVDVTSQMGNGTTLTNLKRGLLDQYMTKKSDWRLNNAQYAEAITNAKAAYDREPSQANKDTLDTALYSVVVPVFKANGEYSLSAKDLYNNLNPQNSEAHDIASKTNKLELAVSMVKLGDIMHVVGLDALNAESLYDFVTVNYDATNELNNYVVINYGTLEPQVDKIIGNNKDLQKVFNRPDKSVHGMKLEVATAPQVIVDSNNYNMNSRDNTFTITGQNLNLITPANTKLCLADGTEIDQHGMKFEAAREDYKSDVVTFDHTLGTGKYILQYAPSAGETVNINLTVN